MLTEVQGFPNGLFEKAVSLWHIVQSYPVYQAIFGGNEGFNLLAIWWKALRVGREVEKYHKP